MAVLHLLISRKCSYFDSQSSSALCSDSLTAFLTDLGSPQKLQKLVHHSQALRASSVGLHVWGTRAFSQLFY